MVMLTIFDRGVVLLINGVGYFGCWAGLLGLGLGGGIMDQAGLGGVCLLGLFVYFKLMKPQRPIM